MHCTSAWLLGTLRRRCGQPLWIMQPTMTLQ
ncbi:hypothetical protein LINPERHAP2_LOCUS38814 [Linum perenne]